MSSTPITPIMAPTSSRSDAAAPPSGIAACSPLPAPGGERAGKPPVTNVTSVTSATDDPDQYAGLNDDPGACGARP